MKNILAIAALTSLVGCASTQNEFTATQLIEMQNTQKQMLQVQVEILNVLSAKAVDADTAKASASTPVQAESLKWQAENHSAKKQDSSGLGYSDDDQDPNAKIWYAFRGAKSNISEPSICMVTTAANPNRNGWVPYLGPFTRVIAKNVCRDRCKSCAS